MPTSILIVLLTSGAGKMFCTTKSTCTGLPSHKEKNGHLEFETRTMNNMLSHELIVRQWPLSRKYNSDCHDNDNNNDPSSTRLSVHRGLTYPKSQTATDLVAFPVRRIAHTTHEKSYLGVSCTSSSHLEWSVPPSAEGKLSCHTHVK